MTSKSQNVSVLLKHLDTPKYITPATTVPIWVHNPGNSSLPKKTNRNQRTIDSVWRIPLGGTLWERGHETFDYPKSNNWAKVESGLIAKKHMPTEGRQLLPLFLVLRA